MSKKQIVYELHLIERNSNEKQVVLISYSQAIILEYMILETSNDFKSFKQSNQRLKDYIPPDENIVDCIVKKEVSFKKYEEIKKDPKFLGLE